MQPVVHDCQQIIRDDAFKRVTVEKAQAEPKAVELGPAEKGFAFGLEVVVEVPNEIDAADFGKEKLLVLAAGREQVDRVDLSEARGVQIATKGLAVEQGDDDFLVGRGWGAKFQSGG